MSSKSDHQSQNEQHASSGGDGSSKVPLSASIDISAATPDAGHVGATERVQSLIARILGQPENKQSVGKLLTDTAFAWPQLESLLVAFDSNVVTDIRLIVESTKLSSDMALLNLARLVARRMDE